MLCPLAAASAAGFCVGWMPGTPLGQVRGGVLRLLVPVQLIDRLGGARLPCPRCGTARHWFPAGATAVVAAPRLCRSVGLIGPAARGSGQVISGGRVGIRTLCDRFFGPDLRAGQRSSSPGAPLDVANGQGRSGALRTVDHWVCLAFVVLVGHASGGTTAPPAAAVGGVG